MEKKEQSLQEIQTSTRLRAPGLFNHVLSTFFLFLSIMIVLFSIIYLAYNVQLWQEYWITSSDTCSSTTIIANFFLVLNDLFLLIIAFTLSWTLYNTFLYRDPRLLWQNNKNNVNQDNKNELPLITIMLPLFNEDPMFLKEIQENN